MQTPGRWTGCALENTDALAFSLSAASPHTAPFRHEAARLSLELAATAYDLDVTPWQQAGWQDFSYQLDHALMTGQRLNQSEGSRLRNTVSEWMHRLARHRGHRADPIAQVRGALRQRENGDACRAVVMLRQEGAHCIVAIGFMGTRRLLSDWVSNLRVQRQDDMHQGFLQLAESFEDACAEIRFPSAAQAMGLAELTLADILMACTRPESPFRIWMAGHSGGAVAHRPLLHADHDGCTARRLLRRSRRMRGLSRRPFLYSYPDGYPRYADVCHRPAAGTARAG